MRRPREANGTRSQIDELVAAETAAVGCRQEAQIPIAIAAIGIRAPVADGRQRQQSTQQQQSPTTRAVAANGESAVEPERNAREGPAYDAGNGGGGARNYRRIGAQPVEIGKFALADTGGIGIDRAGPTNLAKHESKGDAAKIDSVRRRRRTRFGIYRVAVHHVEMKNRYEYEHKQRSRNGKRRK